MTLFKSATKHAQTTTSQTMQIQQQQTETAKQMQREEMQNTKTSAFQPKSAHKSSIFDKSKEDEASKTKSVYTLPKSEVRNNFSDERLDAFQENLRYNVSLDKQYRISSDKSPDLQKAFDSMMNAIESYALLSPLEIKREKQAAAIQKAQKSILDFLKKSIDRDSEETMIANRYRVYFETFSNGNLRDHEKALGVHIDASTKEKEPQLHTEGLPFVHYTDRRNDPLFPHEPSMNDVKQAALGDCYLQAAVSTLVMNDPQKLKETMVDNGDGTVTVRFYQNVTELSEEDQVRLRPLYESEQTTRLWESGKEFNGLTDAEMIFKLLVMGNTASIDSKLKNTLSKEFTPAYERLMDQLAASGKTCSKEEINELVTKARLKQVRFLDLVAHSRSRLQSVHTMKMAEYLAAQSAIKEQIIDKMHQKLEQNDADLEIILTDTLMDLYKLMPETHEIENFGETTALDTPEFLDLLHEHETYELQHPIPTYVTVTKEVPTVPISGDAYSNNCLWMQLLEKAYAASGIHKVGCNYTEQIRKDQQAVQELEAKLQKKHLSQTEIHHEVSALQAKQRERLDKLQHSFSGIEGGFSGQFLETLTGEKCYSREFAQMNDTEMKQQIYKFLTEPLLDALNDWDSSETTRALVEAIIDEAERYLKKKFSVPYKVKENGKTVQKTYCPRPIYLEDLTDLFKNFSADASWLTDAIRSISPAFLEPLKAMKPDANPDNYTLEKLISLIAERLGVVADQNENTTIMHRPFSGHYTNCALKEYKIIDLALKKGIPVTLGTADFLPKGVKATGLNGESEQGGLVEKHAYSVVGVKEENGNYYVQLRNPWASGELGYQKTTYPDGSEQVSSHRVAAKTDGHFAMELNHFLSRIRRLDFNGADPATLWESIQRQNQEGGIAV